jgi:hypothetical protein
MTLKKMNKFMLCHCSLVCPQTSFKTMFTSLVLESLCLATVRLFGRMVLLGEVSSFSSTLLLRMRYSSSKQALMDDHKNVV